MEIILHRTRIHRDTTDGYITIGGKQLCDTAEHTTVMLPPGSYPLTLKHLYFVAGNGVYALREPDIIVGKHRCRGVVIRSAATYRRIYQRLKKALARETVTLVVKDSCVS